MWVGVLLPPESQVNEVCGHCPLYLMSQILQLPVAVRMRFRSLETVQTSVNFPTSPIISVGQDYKRSREPLQKWLLRVQFKVSQIEKQSSHALRFIPL